MRIHCTNKWKLTKGFHLNWYWMWLKWTWNWINHHMHVDLCGGIYWEKLLKSYYKLFRFVALEGQEVKRCSPTVWAMILGPTNWRAERDLKQIQKFWADGLIFFTTSSKKWSWGGMNSGTILPKVLLPWDIYIEVNNKKLPLPILTMVEEVYRSTSFYHTECHLLAPCINVCPMRVI